VELRRECLRAVSRLALTAALAAAFACSARTPASDALSLDSLTIPERPVLHRPFVVQLRVRDRRQQKPMSGAKVEFIGQMNHPGMAPVVVDASEAEAGTYRGSVTLDMAGAWVLKTTVTLPDGRRAEQNLDVDIQP
jgi:hypothetical protein